MKIDATGPMRGSAVRRTGKSAGGGFRIEPADGGEGPVQQAAASKPAAIIDGLLSIQEVPDATTSPSKGLRRGLDILDQLDQLRLSLLAGSIAPQRLKRLLAALRTRRQATGDPRLEAILAEIELRAAVEVAKFEAAGVV